MPEEDEGVIYDVAPPSLAMTLVSGSLQVSEDGTEIAGLHGNQILIWDAATGGSASASIGEPTYAFGLSSLAAAPDFSFFAVPEGGDAIAIKSRTGDSETIALEPWLEDEKVQQIEISPDGERMAVRGSRGLIAIYDLPSRDLEMTLAACADSPGELALAQTPHNCSPPASMTKPLFGIWSNRTLSSTLNPRTCITNAGHGVMTAANWRYRTHNLHK